MKIDGLSVVETIESVEQSMPQQNISEDFKVKVENLILLARIMKDRLTTNSTNSTNYSTPKCQYSFLKNLIPIHIMQPAMFFASDF